MNNQDLEDIPVATAGLGDDLVGPRPTRVRYQVLGAACSLAVITYIHRVGFGTAVAELKTTLDLSASQISWLMAAFMVGYGLFEMPWGFLGDRIGVQEHPGRDHPGRVADDRRPGAGGPAAPRPGPGLRGASWCCGSSSGPSRRGPSR